MKIAPAVRPPSLFAQGLTLESGGDPSTVLHNFHCTTQEFPHPLGKTYSEFIKQN